MGGVVPIEDKMREKRLGWCGHVYRRSVVAIVRRSDMGRVEGSIMGRGSPKLTLQVVVQKDLGLLDITEQYALHKAQWKGRLHLAGPN